MLEFTYESPDRQDTNLVVRENSVMVEERALHPLPEDNVCIHKALWCLREIKHRKCASWRKVKDVTRLLLLKNDRVTQWTVDVSWKSWTLFRASYELLSFSMCNDIFEKYEYRLWLSSALWFRINLIILIERCNCINYLNFCLSCYFLFRFRNIKIYSKCTK